MRPDRLITARYGFVLLANSAASATGLANTEDALADAKCDRARKPIRIDARRIMCTWMRGDTVPVKYGYWKTP